MHRIITWALDHPIKATATTGVAAQLVRPMLSLLTLPMLYAHLGEDRLGIWLIALSFLGIFSFVGGGISASVTTAVARSLPIGSKAELSQIVTAGLALSGAAGLAMVIAGAPVILAVNWVEILEAKAVTNPEIIFLLLSVLAVLVLSLLVSMPRNVMLGRGHGYLGYLLDLVGLAIGTIGLVVAIRLQLPLWAFLVIFYGPSLCLTMIGGVVYLAASKIAVLAARKIRFANASKLRTDAIWLGSYHFFYAASVQTNLIIIGTFIGAAEVVPFAIAHRLFSVLIMLGYAVNQAQWPILARADAENDVDRLRELLQKTIFLVPALAGIVAILLASQYERIVSLWLGVEVNADLGLLVGMVFWVLVASAVNAYDALLRAKSESDFLTRAMAIMAALNVAFLVILVPSVGISGAVWASALAYTLALLLPYSRRARSSIRQCNP